MLQEQHIPRYSYADYAQWEGNWELINGYPYAMSPSPLPRHQKLASDLAFLFTGAIKKQQLRCDCDLLFETDWCISESTIVKPDIMVVCGQYPDDKVIQIPPVLIIEIFSPATRLKDRNVKFDLYRQSGVKYYLMADPDKKTIEVFQLVDNDYKEQEARSTFTLTNACSITVELAEIFD